MALVSSPQIVITGTQLAFGRQDSDFKLAFDRLERALAARNARFDRVAISHLYVTSAVLSDRVMALLSARAGGARSVLPIEALPSLDALFGLDVIAVPDRDLLQPERLFGRRESTPVGGAWDRDGCGSRPVPTALELMELVNCFVKMFLGVFPFRKPRQPGRPNPSSCSFGFGPSRAHRRATQSVIGENARMVRECQAQRQSAWIAQKDSIRKRATQRGVLNRFGSFEAPKELDCEI
jgi:hypothetical protein